MPSLYFLKYGRDLMSGQALVIYDGLADKNDHMLITGFVCVEMQGDLGILSDVRNFMRVRLTENQKGISLPNEPDRSWLRREF